MLEGLFRSALAPVLVPLKSGAGGAGGAGNIEIKMLAHRVYGPGYNSGAAPLAGDGTAKTYTSPTLVNESGAPISRCSIVCQGWTLRTTGTTDTGNTFTPTFNVEYPSGTVVGTATFDVLSGTNSESMDIDLSTPIPAGASFRVVGAATPTVGQSYIANLGFAGLRNHARKSDLKKVAIAGFGDSIMTNNNGALYNAASGRCPVYLNSIIGTTAQTYAANSGASFVRQVDLAMKLGITDVMTNFGTNDFGGSSFVADLIGFITTLRDMVRAAGIRYNHITMVPRTQSSFLAQSVTSAVSSGTTLVCTVADASKYVVGQPARCLGATQTEYVGSFIVTAIDTTATTVTMLFPGSATSPATGTITLGSWKPSSHVAWMQPLSAKYNPGSGSDRGQFNAWVRGGSVDGYIDWADACEPSRDAGRWLVCGESALLPSPQLVTLSSVISTSRFNSNYDRGSSTVANGFVQPATGANTGALRNGSGNTNGDITVTTAWSSTQVVGDTYYVVPGCSYVCDDGTHPRVASGGKGGQALLDNATAAKIDQLLAS